MLLSKVKVTWLLFVLVSASAVSHARSPIEQFNKVRKSGVTEIQSRSFSVQTDLLTQTWFLKFYMPWCGYCIELAPKWVELSKTIADTAPDIRFGNVNAEVESDLVNLFRVRAYPTLVMVHGTKVYTFVGAKTMSRMRKFAEGGYKEMPSFELPSDSAILYRHKLQENLNLPMLNEAKFIDKKMEAQVELPDLYARPISTEPVESPESPDESDLASLELSGLVSFTDANLDTFLQLDPQRKWMVLFVSPLCQKCRVLESVWSSMARSTAESDNVGFGRVNSIAHRGLAKRFSIASYPTIFLLYQGEAFEYLGTSDQSSLVEFMKEGWVLAPKRTQLQPVEEPIMKTQHRLENARHYLAVLFFCIASVFCLYACSKGPSKKGKEF